MSYSEDLIEIFPIHINQGYYNFRHMGEFEIFNSIGKGNFSEIFSAKQKNEIILEDSNKFNYAIKICKKNAIVDNNLDKAPPKKILFNEICEIHLLNKIKNIENPNIIRMYDWDIDRETCEVRILMEYIPYDLKKYFSKKENIEKLDEKLLKRIAFQILNGLNSLHKNRIIHFNLNPENILINGGTYSYMPIEGLLKTKKYSFSYDIWSLGCILLELLCRKNPFIGDDPEDVLNNFISIYGLDAKYLTNFDEFCKNSCNLNYEKKRLVNYIKKNKKIKLINDDLCDLISKMLSINPMNRIKAEEALKHSWFINYTK